MSWRFLPISRFAEVVPIWQELHHKFGGTPLLDPIIVRHLVEQFATGSELLAIHDAAPAAAGILSKIGFFRWQTFQPANAPIGVWMTEPGAEIEPILNSLASSLPGPVMLVGLSQLDPILLPRPEPSKRLATLDYISTANLEIAGSYESYWAARSKNLKHNMKRQRNRLDRAKTTIRLEVVRDPPKISEAVADYARLELSGWKGKVASAVGVNDAQGRFYSNMLHDFAVRDEAIVYRYFYDDRLVASDLCLLRNKVLIILKTTHDEQEKGTSPAHLMRHEVIQSAFQTHDVEQVEFYGPVQDWHLRWTDDVRVMYHINYFPSAMVSVLHGATRKMKRS